MAFFSLFGQFFSSVFSWFAWIVVEDGERREREPRGEKDARLVTETFAESRFLEKIESKEKKTYKDDVNDGDENDEAGEDDVYDDV